MINKITLKNNIRIIDNKYVIKKKKKDLTGIFSYLNSRGYEYYPNIIKEEDNNIYYEYINDIAEPKEQKILDLIVIISILHSKTTIYKEVDIDYYKYLYESINNKIDDTYNYYNMLMDNIDNEVYMSPASYLIARNISVIYNSLNYAKENINKWYKLVENKRELRVVTIHNNLSLDHYLKSNKPYLISWDNYKIDIPIYDLISLYKSHYLDFDFNDLLNVYLSKYPLNKEEMILFLTIISIPNKIEIGKNAYDTVINTRRIIDYVYKTNKLISEYTLKDNKKNP